MEVHFWRIKAPNFQTFPRVTFGSLLGCPGVTLGNLLGTFGLLWGVLGALVRIFWVPLARLGCLWAPSAAFFCTQTAGGLSNPNFECFVNVFW